MRFLTSFLSLLIFFLFLSGVAFYFTREYFLYRGVENFKKAVLVLQKSRGGQECESKNQDLLGVVNTGGEPDVHIRFLSDTDYILEVVCPGYEFDPIELEQRSLDTYVTKLPGSSGISLGAERTGVELVVFKGVEQKVNQWLSTDWNFIQKKFPVVLESNAFVVSQPGEELGSGPLTSCEGYGYQCCQSDTHIGQGSKIEGLLGCENNCFSSCASRPYVLSLTSNPFFDVQNRTVTISSGESIDFSYVIDVGTSPSVQVLLDFGDGVSGQSLEKTGMMSHTYECPADSCEYTAQMSVTDSAGVESAWTPVSRITVVVTP
ncbi:MAG: hypothetical protein QG639_1049 [Patescibacteria group bacterium]|jgi:hypothetical protein|nr:hypothetical protein [Patescibacteria group bacterium]